MTVIGLKKLDLYRLKGKAKKRAMKELQEIVKSNGKNPHITFKALGLLEQEAGRRVKQLEIIKGLLANKQRRMADKALEDFKVAEKVKFMAKHREDIQAKNYTPEIIHGLAKFEKMEKYGCYTMRGLTVFQKDCTTCERKNRCWHSST